MDHQIAAAFPGLVADQDAIGISLHKVARHDGVYREAGSAETVHEDAMRKAGGVNDGRVGASTDERKRLAN